MNRAPALPLTPEHRATLERWLRAGTTAQRVVLRSRIVLLAADGLPSKYIAQRLGTSQDTVRVWRRRFAAGGPDVLTHDAPGRGRKRQITAAREQQVVDATLHTEPPRATHWSLRTMAAAQGLSPASIHRIWHAHGLQPHRVRTFKLSTDPRFVEKLTARRVPGGQRPARAYLDILAPGGTPSPLRAPRRPPSAAPSSRRASVSHGAAHGAFG